MAASKLVIWNMALSHIGAITLNSESDTSVEARKCSLFYEPARDQVLTDFPWNFAERRKALSIISGADPIGYDYAYTYPSDCLKVRKIYNVDPTGEPIKYKVTANDALSAKIILCNERSASLIYTARITTPDLFDASFVILLSWRLAADLAIPLTRKKALRDACLRMYGTLLPLCRRGTLTKTKSRKNTRTLL
jgi:hypothetical protein